jgi:hypothetical protein
VYRLCCRNTTCVSRLLWLIINLHDLHITLSSNINALFDFFSVWISLRFVNSSLYSCACFFIFFLNPRIEILSLLSLKSICIVCVSVHIQYVPAHIQYMSVDTQYVSRYTICVIKYPICVSTYPVCVRTYPVCVSTYPMQRTLIYFLLSILPPFIPFSPIQSLRSARILSAVGLHSFQSAKAKLPQNGGRNRVLNWQKEKSFVCQNTGKVHLNFPSAQKEKFKNRLSITLPNKSKHPEPSTKDGHWNRSRH